MKTVYKHIQFYGPDKGVTAIEDGYYILDKLFERKPEYLELNRRIRVDRLGDKVVLTVRLYKPSKINWIWVFRAIVIALGVSVGQYLWYLFFR